MTPPVAVKPGTRLVREWHGDTHTVLIVVRCKESTAGSLRWHIRLDSGLMTDLTVAVRLDVNNKNPLDYYLLPALDKSLPRLRLAENNGISIDSYRFDIQAMPMYIQAACSVRSLNKEFS